MTFNKHDFTGLYNHTTPYEYFLTLAPYLYILPDSCVPLFRALSHDYRRYKGKEKIRILDIGCSYGINSLIYRHNLSTSILTAHYVALKNRKTLPAEIREWDKKLINSCIADKKIEFVGLDIAENALEYSQSMGLIESYLSADLENNPLETIDKIGNIDIIMSTGTFGYITAATFSHVLSVLESQPWIFITKLEDYSWGQLLPMLSEAGYRTLLPEHIRLPQRLMVDASEANGARDAAGWLWAEALFAIPHSDRPNLAALDQFC